MIVITVIKRNDIFWVFADDYKAFFRVQMYRETFEMGSYIGKCEIFVLLAKSTKFT